MSSRAAASRKRLAGEDKRPSSSKGFFSRSKSANAVPPQLDPSPFVDPSHVANREANRPGSSRSPLDLEGGLARVRRNSVDTISQRTISAPYGGSRNGSPYPSPPQQEYQAIRISPAGSPVTQSPTGQVPYIEASYQPPPPIIATYQPPPPVHFTSALPSQTAYPDTIEPLSGVESLSSFPAPPSYPPPIPLPAHLPSPSTSPPQTSLLLQSSQKQSPRNDSPTPTYTSSHLPLPEEQYLPSPPHIPASLQPQAYVGLGHAYPSPPPSTRLSPLRVSQVSLSSDSSSSSDSEIAYIPREASSSNAVRPITPQRVAFPISPQSPGYASPHIRYAESTSGSSDSSGRSPVDAGPSSPTPKFIFPGSRSVAKPKVSKKISTSAINVVRAPVRQEDFVAYKTPESSSTAPAGLITQRQDSPLVSDTASTNSGGSSSSSNNSNGSPSMPPSGYRFPVGRSKAQPSKVPTFPKRRFGNPSEANAEGGRRRFIGLLVKKKKKSKEPLNSSRGPNSVSPPPTSGGADSGSADLQSGVEAQGAGQRIKSRIGSYPFDPYNSILLDNDRLTGELLMRLNPTASPSYHNYGNMPPTSVLDLGCGEGHWVVDAAIAWKGYGTKVTGYDMVDISQRLLSWAEEQGVKDNIRFVQGNFVKQRLPFSDDSFDLVRMSCLALSLPADSWMPVLQEVNRVLMVGGRLELIDDYVFFPYGKAASALDSLSSGSSDSVGSVAPQLDVTIPSASFTTFSIYNGQVTNPGLGSSADSLLYALDEEDVDDDSQTVHEFNPQKASSSSRNGRRPRDSMRYTGISPELWNNFAATSRDLEALFEHMLFYKFGISTDPNDFILGMMKDVFGHAREVSTMHLTLAPPDFGDNNRPSGLRSRSSSSDRRRQSMGLSRSPGLVLWPSTFLPMTQTEIEIHASKHLRLLLSCKNVLVEHALEATDDDEIDEDSVLEAMAEYESFLRHRFNPPPMSMLSRNNSPYLDTDAVSIQESIADSVSADDREEMWQIQSEFEEFMTMSRQRNAEEERPDTPSTPRLRPTRKDSTPTISTFPGTMSSPIGDDSQASTIARDTFEPSFSTPPFYSKNELTHVRTFRVYEAIKLDSALFGTAI
ncbi:hypothetical protein CVT26_006266 [Gymnopilus dilepis]|uniref:Methyltransferase domain-containing protein n=1 Tax=Gymnopilus dilepis TaxID=231916 RepID=A0A409Y1A2_9AGAR|nr:hypothetical protein CVT26_006266 [Gymnopilus dilepis]